MPSGSLKKELPFKVGDSVLAQWPGGSKWYPARVAKNIGKYEVLFDDNTRHVVSPIGVRSPKSNRKSETSPSKRSTSRSRAHAEPSAPRRSRSQSRATSRSPGRPRKSPSRTSRKASPAPKSSPRRRSGSVTRKQQTNSVKIVSSTKSSSKDETDVVSVQQPSASATILASPNNRFGLRERPSKTRMSARVAALQTARVAAVATPGLMAEEIGGAGTKSEILSAVSSKTMARHPNRLFLSSVGIFVFMLLVPAFILAINLMCSKQSCTVMKLPIVPVRLNEYFDVKAVAIFVGWLAFQALLYSLPVGRLVEGTLLRDGTRLKYRMNGPLAFVVSLASVGGLLYHYGTATNVVYRRLFPLAVTGVVFAYVAALLLYVKSRWAPAYLLNPQCSASNAVWDFFMGRELNPRPFGFELKLFLEFRVGLIGWIALNLVFLWKDFTDNAGQISPPLLVSVLFQTTYVLDALWFEEALLTTMDVTTTGLGFMLVVGDVVFIPFVFTLQSRYLLDHRQVLPWYCLAGIVALFVLGYVIFRASNLQKDEFRRNPYGLSVVHLPTIATGTPKKILAGGWWGWVRHPNYVGDILMGFCFCLPAGFGSVIPYTYGIYLFIMLALRSVHDSRLCRQKYGSAWDEYCSRVRYHIINYVF